MAKKKRKYEDVVKSLPRWDGEEPSRREKLDALKAAYAAHPDVSTVAGLAQLYAKYRRKKEEVQQQEAEVNLYLDAISEMMAEEFEKLGVESLKTPTFGISVYLEPYANVEDRDKFREWCIAQGLERSLMLPWSTTNSLTKSRLLEGEPEPDGVTVWSKPKISLRRHGDDE